MLVILEGIDNSGKSYQAKALKSKLEKEGTKVNINKEMISKIRGVTKGLVNEGRIPSLFDKIMNGKVKERKIDYSEWPPPEIIIIDRFIHTVLDPNHCRYTDPRHHLANALVGLSFDFLPSLLRLGPNLFLLRFQLLVLFAEGYFRCI